MPDSQESSTQQEPAKNAATESGETNTPSKAGASSGGWGLAKDVASTIQSCCAIVAFLSAAVWFWAQDPFSPIIKWTVVSTVVQDSNGERVDAELTVENSGHIPFKFRCQGVKLTDNPSDLPSGICAQKAETLAPGEQIVFGQVFSIDNPTVPKTLYVRARIGDVEAGGNSWTDKSSGTTKVLFLSPHVEKVKTHTHQRHARKTAEVSALEGGGGSRFHIRAERAYKKKPSKPPRHK